jgi:hypothetical protein
LEFFDICFTQDHQKQAEAAQTEAKSLKQSVYSTRRTSAQKSESRSKKVRKDKDTKAVLAGKRVLDLAAARHLAPPRAYVYETTDGQRMRVFHGKRRVSTSSLISVGNGLAIHHCLTWAWRLEEAEVNGVKCPYNLSVLKLA